MKLLLHSCCAPCSVQCVQALSEEGLIPDLFWYNPNIHPYTEYRSRREAFRDFSNVRKLFSIMEDDYGLRSFIKGISVSGDNGGGRCAFCYRLRLEKTAATAAEKGYDAFSTTLLISPYQDHDLLREIAETLAEAYGIIFLYRDFRPRFRRGQKEARDEGYYMQKYCGCIYSEEERYLGKSGK